MAIVQGFIPRARRRGIDGLTTKRRKPMPEEIPTNRARQDRKTWQRAAILIAGIVAVAVIIWAGIELYQESVGPVDQATPEATE